MFKKSLLLLFFLSLGIAKAQDIKFGKVSVEELEEKIYPQDSTAEAAYLFRNLKIFYRYTPSQGFELITEVHERIKIYSKDGLDYGTQRVRVYKNGNVKETISGIKGYTYNLVDGKAEDTKLKKDGIFESELSKYRNETKFTFPNVKEGSVIDYKYTITSPYSSNIDEIPFQFLIPIKKEKVRLEIPEYYSFNPKVKGFLTLRPVTSRGTGKIRWTDTYNHSTHPGAAPKNEYTSREVEYVTSVTNFEMDNVPALKREPYVNNIRNYQSAVKYELAYTNFPNSPVENYTSNWEKVTQTIYKSPAFGAELQKDGYFDKEVDQLVSGTSDPIAKAMMIFDFVKNKMTWDGYMGKYVDKGVRKAYKDGKGNVAEINLMLIAMLRYANLDANPVLVSTRNHGVSIFPTREGFNYVIASVNIDGKYMLMDATEKHSVPNVLPYRVLNWSGRMIQKNGNSGFMKLTPDKKAMDVVQMNINLKADGTIEGKCREQYTNHNAMFFRDNYTKNNEEDLLDEMEKEYDFELSNYSVKNMAEMQKPIIETYDILKEDQVQITGDKLYFSPLFYLSQNESPFKLDKREYPVDFGFPWEDKYMINIQVPEGYEIESIPEKMAIALPENMGVFKYNVVGAGDKIRAIVSVNINAPVIPPTHYEALKEFYNQLVKKQTEKVVLKKI